MALENAETAEIIHLDDRSTASEVLEALQLHDSVASLEERVSSMTLDLDRLTAERDEDLRLFNAEMGVMRARVEDALKAFAETEREIKDQAKDDQSHEGLVREMLAGVGDALASMSGSFERRLTVMDEQIDEARAAVERIATAVGTLLNRMDRLDPRSR